MSVTNVNIKFYSTSFSFLFSFFVSVDPRPSHPVRTAAVSDESGVQLRQIWRLRRATNLWLISIQQRAAATLQFVTFSPLGVAWRSQWCHPSACLPVSKSLRAAMLSDGNRRVAHFPSATLALSFVFLFCFGSLLRWPLTLWRVGHAWYLFYFIYLFFTFFILFVLWCESSQVAKRC